MDDFRRIEIKTKDSMKPHVKIYFDYFGYGEQDFIPCEVSWYEGLEVRAVDINHVDCKGMGGNPSRDKDVIENLMAVSRENHIKYGDKKQYVEYLKEVHRAFMNKK